MNYSSKRIEQAVHEISKLPGIGQKTALRLALHLLKRPEDEALALADAVVKLRTQTGFCTKCHNISDTEICGICSSPKRTEGLLCVVEDIRDVMAIENTGNYSGLYHVLGGLISPMDGVGPSDLTIASLVKRVSEGSFDEVVLALNTTMEGDTTNFYLYRKLKDLPVKITTIARGIAVGNELEYTDEVTLGRSIAQRIPYLQSLPNQS
jgi:recombination protein RecR